MNEIHVGIISEGTTDQGFLNEIVCKILEKKRNCDYLQPTDTSSTGWAGLMSYCKHQISSIGYENYIKGLGEPYNLLIVAIDGDATREGTIYCNSSVTICPPEKTNDPLTCYYQRSLNGIYQHCLIPTNSYMPHMPIQNRVDFLRTKILEWCGIGTKIVPSSMIIVVPCDMIESWFIAALDGPTIDGVNVEEYKQPFKRYICQTSDYHGWTPFERGKEQFFKKFQKIAVDNWSNIISICSQAKQLNDELAIAKLSL